MTLTLFEKLDESCHQITVKESVCQQVQRIISTRTYVDVLPAEGGYITGFGVPEIVDQFATNSDNHEHYRKMIRDQILALEPRVLDVEVKSINTQAELANCQLVIRLKDIVIDEQFYF